MKTLHISDKLCISMGVLVLIVYMLPYVILGEDAFINIWDFLDSNVAHMHTIIKMGLIGQIDGTMPMMDGSVPSLFYAPLFPVCIQTWLYMYLSTYWAIVANAFFVKLIAFLGMYVLCRSYILKDDKLFSFFVAIVFAFIPFYVDYVLSSAGIPLCFYAILNLEYNRRKAMSLFIIVFFACNSSLNLIGFFVCLLWPFWIINKWITLRKFPKWHVCGLLIMILIYMYSNMYIIKSYLFPTDFVSHRTEIVSIETIEGAVTHLLGLLKGSHPHIGNFYSYPILLFVIVVLGSQWKTNLSVRKYLYTFVTLLILIYLGSISSLLPIPFFKAFNMSRVFFFYPTMCFILVAKSFAIIARYKDKKKPLLLFLLLMSVVSFLSFTVKIAVALLFLFGVLWFFMNNRNKYLAVGTVVCVMFFFSTITSDIELVNNISRIANVKSDTNPSFRQYYDENLFNIIKKDLKTDGNFSCKVVSLGMQPSIAEYNGLYTIDSYIYSYSLDFKKKFRKVIEKELEKGNNYIQHFDQYGVRCYLFASELEYEYAHIYSKDDKKKVKHLEINTDELKRLGCQYIFSAVEICNFKDLNLSYVNSYSTPQSFFNIRVYQLRD